MVALLMLSWDIKPLRSIPLAQSISWFGHSMLPIVSSIYDYFLLLLSLVLVLFETLATAFTLLIPRRILRLISSGLGKILPQTEEQRLLQEDPELSKRVTQICEANSFIEICEFHGYGATEHVVSTPDGYMLGIHRIPPPATAKYQGLVYLHHGLLMNSEIWVANAVASNSIALKLADAGYEVWLGNNRGNKYSKKHVRKSPSSREFWNFCLDEFAMYDIPSIVDYILRYTERESLTYIGFSQGSAQALAALSIHPELNRKIKLFIALGPAMAPPKVGPRILHSLITASPSLLFILFGHRVILRSTVFWQSIMLPDIFVRMIDISNKLLFNWKSNNISWAQKRSGYYHLYSYTSVKCVVHWFQIIARNNGMFMYDDDTFGLLGVPFGHRISQFYQVPPYPTQNITTPIEIVYGTADSLVDINALLSKLPRPAGIHPVEDYEHLEMIWGTDVPKVIIPTILCILRKHLLKSTKKTTRLMESSDGKLLAVSPPRIACPQVEVDFQQHDQLLGQYSETPDSSFS